MACRCAVGHESPQLAIDMLMCVDYQPHFCSDVWALEQLASALTGGSQPEEHVRLQNTQEYIQELAQGTHDLTSSPGHTAYATYLTSPHSLQEGPLPSDSRGMWHKPCDLGSRSGHWCPAPGPGGTPWCSAASMEHVRQGAGTPTEHHVPPRVLVPAAPHI